MKDSKYLVFIGMGFELVGLVLASVYVGQYLDTKFELKGLGIVSMMVLGLVGWLVHIVQLVKNMDKNSDS